MYTNFDTHQYDDIINLPHPVSKTHVPMDILNRAAQFAPFAALTGHDAAIKETARHTDRKIEPDENQKAILNEKLLFLYESIENKPLVTFTYFVPDTLKNGGEYVDLTGIIKKIDKYNQEIVMISGEIIKIDDILGIECCMFDKYK